MALLSLKSLFSRGGSVLGIDIGTSAVKVVELKNEKGSSVLVNYATYALGSYSNDGAGRAISWNAQLLSGALQELIKESKISTKNTGIAIPFYSSFLSLISVPFLPDEKIAQLIPFEARKYIPVPIDQVSLDWFIVPDALFEAEDDLGSSNQAQQPNQKRVLLMAIHNKELSRFKEVADKTNLQVSFFEIEIFSTLRSLTNTSRLPIMVIDIGAQITKFYIVERGIVFRSYFKNQGGQAITEVIANTLNIPFPDAEKLKRDQGLNTDDDRVRNAINIITKEIFSEANNAINDFQFRYKKTISKIIFTGGGSTLKGFLEESKRMLDAEVELADPFNRVKYPAFLDETLKQIGPEFAVSLGLALRVLESKS